MKKVLVGLLFSLFILANLSAHFQMIYTPDSIVDGSEVPFKLIFTHPFEAGHTMNIGENEQGEKKGMEALYVYHKGKQQEVSKELKKITFTSLENSGEAYDFILDKNSGFRGGGDWILVGVPHPYYEGSEDIYIQQITKVMINKGDIATDWNERVAKGYPEIIPFVKPYAVIEGGIFRGKVIDCEGNPVPEAEIEIEYINYDIDLSANKFTGTPVLSENSPGACVIKADFQGNFEFIPPKAGYWGFAALGAGGEKTFGGKELSLDAVLWIEAKSIADGAVAKADTTSTEAETKTAKTEAPKTEARGNNTTIIIIIIIAVIAIIIGAVIIIKKKK